MHWKRESKRESEGEESLVTVRVAIVEKIRSSKGPVNSSIIFFSSETHTHKHSRRSSSNSTRPMQYSVRSWKTLNTHKTQAHNTHTHTKPYVNISESTGARSPAFVVIHSCVNFTIKQPNDKRQWDLFSISFSLALVLPFIAATFSVVGLMNSQGCTETEYQNEPNLKLKQKYRVRSIVRTSYE